MVIDEFRQTDCESVAIADDNVKIGKASIVIDPVKEIDGQPPPEVETVYEWFPANELLPVIESTPFKKVPFIPEGNPVTVAPVALPPIKYVISVMESFTQTVCEVVATELCNDSVGTESTWINPVNESGGHVPPVVTTK